VAREFLLVLHLRRERLVERGAVDDRWGDVGLLFLGHGDLVVVAEHGTRGTRVRHRTGTRRVGSLGSQRTPCLQWGRHAT